MKIKNYELGKPYILTSTNKGLKYHLDKCNSSNEKKERIGFNNVTFEDDESEVIKIEIENGKPFYYVDIGGIIQKRTLKEYHVNLFCQHCRGTILLFCYFNKKYNKWN